MPTWTRDTAPAGRYRWNRLSWRTWEDFDSAFGVSWDEMISDEITWTQEA
jgi:hypothetical protein